MIRVLGDLFGVPTGVAVQVSDLVVPDGELPEESDTADSSSEPRSIVSGLTGSFHFLKLRPVSVERSGDSDT